MWKRWTRVWLVGLAVTACAGDDPESSKIATPMVTETESEASSALNQPPRINSLVLVPAEPVPGDRVEAVTNADDPDGDHLALNFAWRINGRRIDHGGSSWVVDDIAKGTRIEVEVTASDGRGGNTVDTTSARTQNRPPTIIGVALQPASEAEAGQPIAALAQAHDPDGDALSYRFEWQVNGRNVAESEAQFDTSGLHRGDKVQAFAIASDGKLDSEPVESVIVEIGNAYPKITSNPVGNWSDGGFKYQLEAEDPDHSGPLRFSLRSGPDGMMLDPVLGQVSWKPGADQVGDHLVEVAVIDAHGGTAVQTFQLTVNSVESQPAANAAE